MDVEAEITWSDDNTGTIIGSGQTIAYPFVGQCGPRWVSVRYFDARILRWVICCRLVYVCNPSQCGEDEINYVVNDNGQVGLSVNENFEEVRWQINNEFFEGNAINTLSIPIPIPTRVCVRYRDPFTTCFYLCCRTITTMDDNMIGISSQVTPIECHDDSTGRISLGISGGSGNFSVIWSNGQTSNTISNLPSGNYQATITDNITSEVEVTQVFTIENPNEILISLTSIEDVSCFQGNDGRIVIDAAGGTGNLTFRWSNSQTTSSITNLVSGTYSLTVTDQNNCEQSVLYTIDQPGELEVSIVVNADDATASVNGGSTPYTYLWDDPLGQSTSTATNLPDGTYRVTIRDANDCILVSQPVTISSQIQPIEISANVQEIECHDESSGSISLNISGGSGNFSVIWSSGQATNTISNLSSGNYQAIITDNNTSENKLTEIFTLENPDEIIINLVSIEDADCFQENDGRIAVNTSGGTGNIAYRWNNFQTSSSINNLASGNYSVTATDQNGCEQIAFFTIGQPNELEISIIVNADDAIASVIGGSAPYSFSWDDPIGQSTATATNLALGTYRVTVTDANGCTIVSQPVIISSQIQPLEVSANVGEIECHDESTGRISLSISGGSGNFSVIWSNGQTSTTISNLSSGNYQATITDSNTSEIELTQVFTIENPDEILIDLLNIEDVNCFQDNDGKIAVNALGGTGDLSYRWNNFQTSSSINNLASGNYTVTVTDQNGCEQFASYTIDQPDDLEISIIVNGDDATASVIGGSAPYSFRWDDPLGQSTATAINLGVGTYRITVTDANGCTIVSQPVIISSQIQPLEVSANVGEIECHDDSTGRISLNISGGSGNISVAWSNGQTSTTISNLPSGNYQATITDNNTSEVEITEVFIIENPDEILIDLLNIEDVNCFQDNDGRIAVNATGGTGSLNYRWNNFQTSSSINNLPSGNYTVSVADQNGCEEFASYTIEQPDVMIASFELESNTAIPNTIDVEISVIGGVPAYSYRWNDDNEQQARKAIGLTGGDYICEVTDANGCVSAFSVTVPFSGSFTISSNITNNPCNDSSLGSIQLNIMDGSGDFDIAWSNGERTTSISSLTNGVYMVTVTDIITEIEIVEEFEISSPESISINGLSIMSSCFGADDGEISIQPIGGTGSFDAVWSNGDSGLDIKNLSPGEYTATITDSNDCEISRSYIIQEKDEIQVDFDFSQSGSVAVLPSGNSSTFDILWTDGSTEFVRNGLPIGIYDAVITDSFGCQVEISIEINDLNVSTSNLSEAYWEIYPNPTSGELYISFDPNVLNQDNSIQIYDLFGKLLDEYPISKSNVDDIQLNLTYKSGVYMILFKSEQVTWSTKIVLTK